MRPGGGARILIVDSLDFCGPDVQAIQVSAQLDFWLAELEARTAALDRTLQQLAERAKLDMTAVLAAAGGVAAAVGAAARWRAWRPMSWATSARATISRGKR